MKLTRRDRAAMVLALTALESIRGDIAHLFGIAGTGVALDVLVYGPSDLYDAVHGARVALFAADWQTAARILRARLALALRVLLRVDAGDFGQRVVCPGCGDRLPERCRGGESIACEAAGDGWRKRAEATSRVRPLWESAPAHKGAT